MLQTVDKFPNQSFSTLGLLVSNIKKISFYELGSNNTKIKDESVLLVGIKILW